MLSASLLTGGVDKLFSRSEAGATQSVLTDALGSTLRLTDATGGKVVDYTYEAYGKATNDNAVCTNSFQYTGRENDGTELQFNRARYYHPQLGRFISEDPIRLAGGYNQYAYVGGNPLSYVDPYGLYEIPIIDGFIRDFYAGKEVACLERAKQQWADWLRESNNTPLSQMRPSDWYIQGHAPAEIAQLAIRQGTLIGGAAAETTLVPRGITGRSPNPQLGIGLMVLDTPVAASDLRYQNHD